MKKLFLDTSEFEKILKDEFFISEEIMIENVGNKIAEFIRKRFKKGSKILALCGGGNNGSDGICALRKLSLEYDCSAILLTRQNEINKLQCKIAQKAGVKFVNEIFECDVIIDAIFGTGLNKNIDGKIKDLIFKANSLNVFRLSLDIPSGIDKNGNILGICFKADTTITMGVLKRALFSDFAKDFVGKIKLASLGVSSLNSDIFLKTDSYLLQKSDLKLPKRDKKNTNKGDFGEVYVMSGKFSGASILAGLGANNIGCGKVSLVSQRKIENLPINLMQKDDFANAKVVVFGCGLGDQDINFSEFIGKKCVIDADVFYKKELIEFLKINPNSILTPHPKEFASLLNNANIANCDTKFVQENRFFLSSEFSKKFSCILVLKGANTIISKNGEIYIMPFGSSKLSKGGSGDVLSGIIAGLLAQGYDRLEACISACIAHALSVEKIKINDYALSPQDILEGLKKL